MIERLLKGRLDESINDGKNKVIIIVGARQVGKTTLIENYFKDNTGILKFNGDDPQTQAIFDSVNIPFLRTLTGSGQVIIIDEAQRIRDIGLKLKLIHDNIKDVRVLVSGSSSFELTSGVYESLAGRKTEYKLFPLSFRELSDSTSLLEEMGKLPSRLIYGSYPEIVTSPGKEKELLSELSESFLYKDILSYERIKKSDKLVKLIQALAFQIGSQVSYNELGQTCGLSSKTVDAYINILERSYIIFSLGSYSGNLRNELKFSRKIYFYDNGVRNAAIRNYAPLELRSNEEKGALWENYLISERMKRNEYSGTVPNSYFWRTTLGQEIDYLEDIEGKLSAYEIKWNPKKKNTTVCKSFHGAYPDCPFTVVTPENYYSFLL